MHLASSMQFASSRQEEQNILIITKNFWKKKQSPRANFTNIIRANFAYVSLFDSFSSYISALAKKLYEKIARKTLIKLTLRRINPMTFETKKRLIFPCFTFHWI